MFGLMPRKDKKAALLPRVETPSGFLAEEFPVLFNRLMSWPIAEMREWPYGWGVTTEETDKEVIVRYELPGFELDEVKVTATPETLTVEAEHREPAEEIKGESKEKIGEKPERAHTCVKNVESLPPEVDSEKAEATYRNGMLEVRLPRKPEAVGRRIEVKS